MALTADQVVTRYTDEIWNKGNLELIRELCADPITRHEAGKVVLVSQDEQIRRISAVRTAMQPFFENVIQASDGTYVAAAYQCRTKPWPDDGAEIPDSPWIDDDFKDNPAAKSGCGIEIFKVVDGRITDVWNHPVMEGVWA